jgi:cysteinyl-tRNA synthetase
MLKIYNTLTKKIENLEEIEKGKIKMYLCGPTVYDFAHLGHGRSAASFDLIRRYLIYKGYKVKFVSNYTDIDDKMIKRANEEKITVKELAQKIIPEYESDYEKLNILKADIHPKATDYISVMIEMLKTLIEKKFAYELKDGIYFDISKFKDYGKLSHQKLDELIAGARVTEDKNKKNPQDFVLWKSSKANEPSWGSPWGLGRPGWHIECSAMNFKIFGETLDIHGGGLDLTFPHHECEIAQSEAYTGKQFVKYWMHNGFVKINNEKMSKSLNNFFTLKDIFKQYDPLTVRYLLISTHYRAPIDFSDQILNQAKNSIKRLHDFMFRLNNVSVIPANLSSEALAKEEAGILNPQVPKLLKNAKENFEKSLDNDFDISGALSAVFDLIREVNALIDQKTLTQNDIKEIKNLIEKFDSVLALLKKEETSALPEEIKNLIKDRDQARKNKNWIKSDELRNILKEKGYDIEDSKEGTKCKKI